MIRALFPHPGRKVIPPGRLAGKTSIPPQPNRLIGAAMVSLAIAVLHLTLPPPLQAVEPVTGRYLSSYGTIIELDLQVRYPPPASLIIEQYFPAGLQVIGAQPALQKYSSVRGIAKWFLKGIRPGSYTISVQFDQPVQASAVRAVIRYRYPLHGRFVEYRITP